MENGNRGIRRIERYHHVSWKNDHWSAKRQEEISRTGYNDPETREAFWSTPNPFLPQGLCQCCGLWDCIPHSFLILWSFQPHPPSFPSFLPSFCLLHFETHLFFQIVALSSLNTPLFVTEPGIPLRKFSKPNSWNFNSDEEISLSVWEARSPMLFSFSPLCFHSDARAICISFWALPIEQLSVSNRMGKIQGTAPHPSKLRTYHLTISTPLGLRRTVLPRLNVISASNNYLLLEKNLLRDVEPTGAFDFKACLVIPKFQLGKEIRNYLSRTRHFTGTITTFHREKRACFIVWCAMRFLIKETAFLRLNLP